MVRGRLIVNVKSLAVRAVCAAFLVVGAVGSVWAEATIVIKNGGVGWNGLAVKMVADEADCKTNKALHTAKGTGNGDYVFTGVADGDYVVCVNREVGVDVTVSGDTIIPDLLDFDPK